MGGEAHVVLVGLLGDGLDDGGVVSVAVDLDQDILALEGPNDLVERAGALGRQGGRAEGEEHGVLEHELPIADLADVEGLELLLELLVLLAGLVELGAGLVGLGLRARGLLPVEVQLAAQLVHALAEGILRGHQLTLTLLEQAGQAVAVGLELLVLALRHEAPGRREQCSRDQAQADQSSHGHTYGLLSWLRRSVAGRRCTVTSWAGARRPSVAQGGGSRLRLCGSWPCWLDWCWAREACTC